jgi:dUTP pyrophosphatase
MSYGMDIQILDESLKEFYQNKKNHGTDSGFDLYVPESITFRPGETKIVDLKVKARCHINSDSRGYYMYPRSSISKTPLTMCNSVGIIDQDYRGNIMVALRYNIDKSVLKEWTKLIYKKSHINSSLDDIFNENYEELPVYTLERGTRIVQLTMPTLEPFRVNFVDELDKTERGEGGFGSTGK